MNRRARRMIALLDRERNLLLAGRMKEALSLTDEKRILTDAFEASDMQKDTVTEIRTRATRNAELIAAARRGVSAAAARIEAIRNGSPVGTYGANGARTEIGGRDTTVTRRA